MSFRGARSANPRIHRTARMLGEMDSGLDASHRSGMTTWRETKTRSHLPAMHPHPSLRKPSAPRGRGECQALWRARSLACKSKKARKQVTTSSPGHPAFPHANGFNGLWRALPGDRALLSPFSASTPKRQCRGDASVEASGPHAFAVRELRLRLLTWLASTASSAQRFVTTAKRPS
jgi:hypothetical protein